MKVQIAHPHGACSTLLISDIPHYGNGVAYIEKWVHAWFMASNPKEVEHKLDFSTHNHKVTSFAIVTVSLQKSQKKAREKFENLGFTFTDWVYNTKNGTWASFGVVTVKDLKKVLKERAEASSPKATLSYTLR